MSSPVAGAQTSPTPTAGASSAGAGAPAAGAASSAGNVTSATTVSNVQDMQKRAPQVYKAMVLGIAQNICNQMHDSSDHLIQMEKEYNEQ